MTLDRFGRKKRIGVKTGPRGERGEDGVGFKLTEGGDYDMEGKVLKNAADPTDTNDVSTKGYVDRTLNYLVTLVQKQEVQATEALAILESRIMDSVAEKGGMFFYEEKKPE